MKALRLLLFGLLASITFLSGEKASAQNIFNGEGVNWVGQINGYAQPTNLSANYRVLTYRRYSVATGTPTDGRGQWTTTVNVQNTGGNVTPLNMTGGINNGFIFTSGPSGGQFNNKWAFTGVGQAGINAVNGATYFTSGGQDMGLNMSTQGHYTFNMQDNGYAGNSYFVGYTSAAPVTVTHTVGTQQVLGFNGLRVGITTSAAPSNENVYVRYRITTNDFTASTVIVQATGSGTSWTAQLPMLAAGSVLHYNVFTSTRTLAQLTGDSEFARSLAVIRYVDNAGSNYSFTFPANPIIVSSTGGTASANYATLTGASGAFAAINAGTHTGAISIGINASVTTEDGVNSLNASGSGLASYTSILIQPNFAATLSGANTTALINLNGADNVTIDGRIGGTGTTKSLTISNTSTTVTTGGTIRFVADATSNIIRWCILQGVGTATSSAVIYFGSGTAGNDNNTITECDIRDGATTPTNGILSAGTTTSTVHNNSGITISNCNIFNIYSSTVSTASIWANTGSTDWTVSGNSFYHTVSRVGVTGNFMRPIYMDTGSNHVISGNFVGGTAPFCGGTALTISGTAASYRFTGIHLAQSTVTTSSIQGNTVANINWLTTSGAAALPGVFSGIYSVGQNVNVGNVTGNTIGSGSGTGNITLQVNTTNGALVAGIGFGTSATIVASNNTIGSFSLSTTGTNVGLVFRGIVASSATTSFTAASNVIGSLTTPNSINLTTSSGTNPQSAMGIACLSSPSFALTGNTIANINNASTTTSTAVGTQTAAIYTPSGSGSINSNTIFNIVSASASTTAGSAAALVGILNQAATAPITINQNTIHSLSLTGTAAHSVVGLYYEGPASGTNLVSRNFIHSLNSSSTNVAGNITGLLVAQGTTTFQNNMIRVGLFSSANSITSSITIDGIRETLGGNNYYFNSVYVGGSGVTTGAATTYAFNSSVSASIRNFRNNIFFNARSNSTGTGVHFAARYGGTGVNPVGLTASHNVLFANGTGGAVGQYNSVTYSTLGAFQTATGQDASSISANPNFIAPTGTSVTVDLHVSAAGTPVEQAGILIAGITDDFDGQTRSGLTPTDVGADAGNFTAIDASAPAITYTLVSTPLCAATSAQTVTATITDASGVPTTGVLVPRLYYRIDAGAYTSVAGTLASGTATNGTWNFAIPAQSPSASITISYYIIAQDVVGTPNIGSNPGGVVATNVNTITTHPTSPNTYAVNPTMSGNYNVGAGQTFTTLTAAVNAYNNACLGGAVTFTLTDASYTTGETFPITINGNPDASATNTLTVRPSLANTVITGTSTSGIIVLNGADWIRIDGSISNTVNTICPLVRASRDLTITNSGTGTSSAVVWLQTVTTVNPATNNIVRNCNIVGGSNSNTVAGIGIGSSAISNSSTGTGNINNRIENNSVQRAIIGIYTKGASVSNYNTGTIISLNTMTATGTNAIGKWGIYGEFEDGIQVTSNTVGEITTSGDKAGILLGYAVGIGNTSTVGSAVINPVVTGNTVYNLEEALTNSAVGIAIGGASGSVVTLANNVIYSIRGNATPGDFVAGIALGGISGTTYNVYHNSVSMNGTQPSGTAGGGVSAAFAVTGTGIPTLDVRNNIFSNTQIGNTASTTRFVAMAFHYSSTTGNYLNMTSNFNNLYAAGAGPGTYHVGVTGGLSATGVSRTTLANWQTETGRDANSLNLNPGFVSSSNLHVTNAALNNVGTPILSVTTDMDCEARSATTPDIGADEFNVAAEDAGVTAIAAPTSCPGAGNSVQVTVFNFGATTLNTVDIIWSVNGGSNTTQSFTGLSIASGASGVVTVTGVTFAGGASANSFTAATDLPNGSADGNSANNGFTNSAILTALSGTYTVGAAGDFATLPVAIARATTSGLCGPTLFSLLDATYTLTSTLVIGQLTGASATNTLTIKPATGVNATITGAATINPIIRLDGADFVIIDGTNSATANVICPTAAASRNLTISTNSTNSTASAVVWIQTGTASNGATNNTIQNCVVVGNSNTTTLFGLGTGNSTISATSTGTGNNGNRFFNNDISRVQYGIYSMGASAANRNTGTQIALNAMQTASPNNVGRGGIVIGFEDGALIRKNAIDQIVGSNNDVFGINVGFAVTDFATGTTGANTCINTTITENTIGEVTSTGAFSAMGIAHGASPSGTTTIANNMVTGVRANATTNDYVSGILLSGAAGSTSLVYNNSVYMTGTIAGTNNFNSSSAALTINGTATPTVDVRNNILVNDQVTNGGTAGRFFAIALAYSSTTGNYTGLTSNKNNLFVASGSTYHVGVTGGIGAGGTVRTTLAAWQTETGRDAASVNGMPAFISSTNLRLNAASTANLPFDGSADALAAVTVDIDCDARNATTPDIGVDEFTTTVSPFDIGVSTIVLPSPLCAGANNVQATITNFGSAAVSAFDVSWEVNGTPQTTASFTSTTIAPGASATVTLGSFTFPNAFTPNTITATTVLGTDATTANDAFTQNNINTALSGTYTVGTAGDFATITAAVARANAVGVCGPTVFSLINASYTSPSETFPITINPLVGSSAVNTLTIKPSVTSSISGTNAAGIFLINGADNIIIDGSIGTTANSLCPTVSATRDLTVTNGSGGTVAPVIWLTNVGVNGATNNIVRNCVVVGNGLTNYGIGSGGPSYVGATAANTNNRFENNDVRAVQIGIYSVGVSTANYNTGTVIHQNVMTATSPNNIGRIGIQVGYENGVSIQGNNIENISGTASDAVGISVGLSSIIRSASAGTEVIGATVNRNRVHAVTAGANSSPVGISVGAGAGASNVISNNMISGVLYNGTSSTDLGAGVLIWGGGASGVNLYNNTILIEGSASSAEALNMGIGFGPNTGSVAIDIRNNLIVNKVSNSGAGKSACIGNGVGGTVAAAFSGNTQNFNSLFAQGTNASIIGYSGFSISSFDQFFTLGTWQTANAGAFDANSVSANAVFVSASDLHVQPLDINNLDINANATVIAGITTDFDCETRNATTPDIGADEYTAPDCSVADGGTIAPAVSAFCANGATTLSSTGFTLPFAGIAYSWESSPDGTTNWTATGGDNPTLFNTGTLTTTTFYRLAVTCSVSSALDYSNVISVTINPNPTASVTPSGSAAVCTGSSQTLTVSTNISGSTFQWFNGATLLSGETNATYSATTAGIYSCVVTTSAGCSTTSNAVEISVNPAPTAGSAAIAPNPICEGGTVNLTSSATASGNYVVTSIAHGALTPSGTPSTIHSTGDDNISAIITLPFTFNYFGNNRTAIRVSTNGWLSFVTSTSISGPSATALPNVDDPAETIYGLWDDLNVTGGGLVRQFTNGVAPNRVFVVDYANVKFYNSAANNGNVSFQIHLYETSNRIEVHITEATDPVASAKTIGIENLAETVAFTPPVRNFTTFGVTTGSPEAWRFTVDAITYAWTGPNGFTSTLQNPSITNVTAAAAGTYTATYTNGYGCSAQASTSALVVNTRPTASITGTNTICNGASTNVTINVTGTGPFSGTLSNGATFSGAGPTFTITVSPSTTTTYTVATLSDALCTAQAGDLTGSAVVTVNARPTAAISGSTTICAGSSATLTLAVTGTGTISGLLSTGTPFSGTAPTITVNVTPTGTTTYLIASVADANCSGIGADITGAAVVTVNTRPTGTISGTTTLCAGTSATLTLSVTGSGSISGTLSDGTPFSGTAPTITLSVTPALTTTYTIATLSDANCSALSGGLAGSAAVTVNARPTASISGTASLCLGSSANLTLTVTGSGTITGTLSSGDSFSGTAPTITVSVSPTSATTYSIATLSDANCSALAGGLTGSATITVNPRPTAAISGTQTMCSNASATLTLSVTGSGTISGTLSDGTSFSGTAPTITVSVTPVINTTYTVATLIDANCNSIAADRTGSAVVTIVAAQTYFADLDGDGYSSGTSFIGCNPGVGYFLAGQLLATSGDCDDTNSDRFPTADEFCNGIDEDCDTQIDEGLVVSTYFLDADGDGFGNPAASLLTCAAPAGYVTNNGDCLDSNASVNPTATEVCNGIDDDCDLVIDEGCGPANDARETAQILAFTGFNNCNQAVTGTLLGATPSSSGTFSSCVTGEDVWYYFTPTTTAARIICTTAANNVVLELQTQAGALVDIENANTVIGNEIINIDGLTPLQTYFIVVRNFNSNVAVGAPFTLCVNSFTQSGCNSPTGPSNPYSFCGSFKADFVPTAQYVFNLTPQPSGPTIVGTSSTTLIPLASIPGIQYGVSYTVRVDAVYTVVNGAGVTETITVEGLPSANCTLTMAAQPTSQLRASDSCPNFRNRKGQIAVSQWVCGAVGFEWEFTQVAPVVGLPQTFNVNAPTRFLSLAQVPFLVAGGVYDVRVRPIFGNGANSSFTAVSCLQLVAPAMVLNDGNGMNGSEALKMETTNIEAIIYPNPNNGSYLDLAYSSAEMNPVYVRITDAMGRVIWSNSFLPSETWSTHIVFERPLASGLYAVEFLDGDTKTVERFIVQR